MRRPTSIDGPALIAGFAVYVPVPGLRGALFGLFPGVAFRDYVLMLKGAALGLLLDVGFLLVWPMLGLVWEPRGTFNRTINDFLPPEHMVVTHCGCPVPEAMQFTVGLAGWSTCFILLWLFLWPKRLANHAYLTIPFAGAVLTSLAAMLIFYFAPMNRYRHAPEAHTLSEGPFFALFISAVPLCTLIVGLLFAYFPSASPNSPTIATEPSDAAKREQAC